MNQENNELNPENTSPLPQDSSLPANENQGGTAVVTEAVPQATEDTGAVSEAASTEVVEAFPATPATDGTAAVNPSTANKKNGLILGGIAASLVLIGCIVAFTISVNSPGAKLTKAFETTAAAAKKQQNVMAGYYPYLDMTGGTLPAATQKAVITLNSIDGDIINPMFAAMFTNTKLNYDYAWDTPKTASNVSISLDAMGTAMDLLGTYQAPELTVINMPPVLSKPFAFNPKTFVEDFKVSPLYVEGMTDEDIASVAAGFSSQANMAGTMSKMDSKQFQEKTIAIFKPLMKKAMVKKEGNVFTATLPGKDIKAALVQYYHYLYLDSPMKDTVGKALGELQSKSGATGPEAFVEEITRLIPELDATLEVTVDGSNVIRSGKLAATSVVTPDFPTPVFFEPMVISFTDDSKGLVTFDMVIPVEVEKSRLKATMSMAVNTTETVYSTDIMLDIINNEFTVKIPFKSSYFPDGKNTNNLALTAVPNKGNPLDVSFSFNGTVGKTDGVVTYTYPDISLAALLPTGESLSASLGMEATVAPLVGEVPVPEGYVQLFSLTEEEITELTPKM